MIEADFIAVTKEQVCSITGGGGSGEARSYGGGGEHWLHASGRTGSELLVGFMWFLCTKVLNVE